MYQTNFCLNLVVSYIVSHHPNTQNVSIIVIFCLKRVPRYVDTPQIYKCHDIYPCGTKVELSPQETH